MTFGRGSLCLLGAVAKFASYEEEQQYEGLLQRA